MNRTVSNGDGNARKLDAYNAPLDTIHIHGLTYLVRASAFVLTGSSAEVGKNDKVYPDNINTKDIHLLSISLKFNEPFVRGTILFTDREGRFDKYLCNKNAYMSIYVNVKREKIKEGTINNGNGEEIKDFLHNFIIENILITGNHNGEVLYKVELVSAHIVKLLRKIPAFSTHDNTFEGVLSKVKDLLTGMDILTDDKSKFTLNDIGANILYISGLNDNFFSVYDYMMNMAYSKNPLPSGLKGIYFDYDKDKVCSATLGISYNKIDVKYMNISYDGVGMPLLGLDEIRIGNVSRKPNTQVITSMFGKKRYIYDHASNSLKILDDVLPLTMSTIYSDNNELNDLYKSVADMNDSNSMEYTTDWDNPALNYNSLVSNMIDNMSPIIQVNASHIFKVGSCINLTTTSSSNKVGRFYELGGTWSIGKVETILTISNGDSGAVDNCIQKLCLVKCHLNNPIVVK